jgi:Zn-dependent protease/CBS domain-containing protein
MKWSWKIANVGGIDIYVHSTFLILVAWIGMSYWFAERTAVAVVSGVGFVLALFGCIVLHELGHAMAARHYGIATRDITLLPIGGVARLERMPERPWEEFVVALAGPFVNVVIAFSLMVWLWLVGWTSLPLEESIKDAPFLARLMVVNVLLVVFNLLPAFPMDGGRVLRALLATRFEYTRATQIAASVGQGFALVLGFLGLFSNPFLVFIALFVWIGAAQEASLVQIRSAIAGIPVRQAMITDFRSLTPDDSLQEAVELTLTGAQKDFPVVESESVVGILTQNDLFASLASRGSDALVRDVMQRDVTVADSREMLEGALRRIEECGCRAMPVLERNRLVGLMTMDNIGEFLRVQAALGTERTRVTEEAPGPISPSRQRPQREPSES